MGKPAMGKPGKNGNGNTKDKSLETKIIRQIEYYFGDHNLKRDKFLKEAITEDEGWVSLETLLKFNRLKTLTTDKELIIKALKKSPNQLMEVSEDETKLRRSVLKPLSEDANETDVKENPRSIYAKGFPQDTLLDDILEFFETQGVVENVYMRRWGSDKKFKGSVFALFKTEEEAEKFVTGKDVCFKGIPLIRETSKHYYERKAKETKKGKKNKNKEEKSEDQPAHKSQDFKLEMKKGCILHLTGFKGATSREDIKEAFDDYAKVAWVDFSRGESEAFVRFNEEGMAIIALEKAKESNDGKLEIRDVEITSRIVDGDEEVEYWNKIKELMQKMKERKSQRYSRDSSRVRGRGGRFGRDNRQNKRRKHSPEDEEADDVDEKPTPKSKVTKFESDEENSKSNNGGDSDEKTKPEIKVEPKIKLEPEIKLEPKIKVEPETKPETELSKKRKLRSDENPAKNVKSKKTK